MRKIIYLDQVIGPISIDLLNEFLQKGAQVELYYGQSFKTYADIPKGVKVHKKNPYHRESFSKRLGSWSRFFISTFWSLFFRRKNFELFIVTNPPLSVFTGYFLNLFFGVKYYLLVFDVYPDAIVQYNYLKEGHPVIRIWKYMMRKSLRRAEKVFTISEVMKKSLEKYNRDSRELIVINNWVDNRKIRPVAREENHFAREHGLQDKKVILYSGNFGKTHDMECILEAAGLLKDHKDIHFLIIGDGEKRKMMEEKIKEGQLLNVTLLPFQPEEIFPYSITCGDLAIVTLGLGAESLSVPSKTYYMMAAGCAVISLAAPESELAHLVEKHEIGKISSPGEPQALVKNILDILENEALLHKFKINSRETSALFTPENAKIFSREMSF